MHLSIIIPTKNRQALLQNTVDALLKQIQGNDEIIIVDNGSTDQTRSYVCSLPNVRVTYLFEPRCGPSYARNSGYAVASNEAVAFLDDDCIVNQRWVRNIKSTLAANKNLSTVFVGKIIHIVQSGMTRKALFEIQQTIDWKSIRKTEAWKNGHFIQYIHAGNFFASQKVLSQIHPLFDASSFPYIGEERDLAYQLQCRGVAIKYLPNVTVHHIVPTSSLYTYIKTAILYGVALGKLSRRYRASSYARRIFALKSSLTKQPFLPYTKIIARFRHAPITMLEALVLVTLKRVLIYGGSLISQTLYPAKPRSKS